jgi:hypothetical protein
MQSDIKKTRAALDHSGLKGSSFEEIFRDFLRGYLPKTLDVSTGIIIDSKGNSSKQLDVIISDSAKTPIFYKSGDIRVVPVEGVFSVIEVKACLNSQELTKTFNNMLSVRKLEKISYVKPTGIITYSTKLYGREWEIWPINYYLFAFTSTDLTELTISLDRMQEEASLPEFSRIDMVCVLDKGVICNQLEDGKFNALPEPNSKLFLCHSSKALLLFYTLMSRYLFQTWLPNFKFVEYLGQLRFGD